MVRIAGDQSGMPVDLSATTNANGSFRVDDVPEGTYPTVEVALDGYRTRVLHDVVVAGHTRRRIGLVRDWASLAGGARLMGATGTEPHRGRRRLRTARRRGRIAGDQLAHQHPQRPAVDHRAAAPGHPRLELRGGPLGHLRRALLRHEGLRHLDPPGPRTLGPGLPHRATASARSPDHGASRAGVVGVRYVRLVLRSAAHSVSQVEFTELVVRGVV